jgi:hypothetical protein
MLLREIAAEMGAGLSTVNGWLSDPDGSRLAARKRSYAGICIDCGAATDGSDGPGLASKRCLSCWAQYQREAARWTRRAIITAINVWADEHGGIPPTASAWNATLARQHPEGSAAGFLADRHRWPATSTVVRRFGSWSAAVRAADLEPWRPGPPPTTAPPGSTRPHGGRAH